jgi:hypothetical protein
VQKQLEIAHLRSAEAVSDDMNHRFNYKWKFRIEHFYQNPTLRVEVKENALLEVLQIPMV